MGQGPYRERTLTLGAGRYFHKKRSRCGAGLRRDRPLVRPSEGKSS